MGAPLDLGVDRRSDLPVGAQLTARIRHAVAHGRIAPGERLPSVRELAVSAGVSVNTARAAYARLEADGLVRSEQGRGTFVAARQAEAAPSRRDLHAQIAALEATLARLPPVPLPGDDEPPRAPAGAALLSTEDLVAVRDRLMERLGRLEEERSALLRSLDELRAAEVTADQAGEATVAAPRSSTPSLAGARIRWVGA